jgi:DNA-binding Lrp family transcriptional regulator
MLPGVDELDIALLDMLHANPQATFDELGQVLDIAPVTAARRWRRLTESGRAWVSSAIGPRLPVQAAVFEAECDPGTAATVAAEFASRPHVFSVNVTTGTNNIYALLVAADQPLLTELMVRALPVVAGVRRVRCAAISELFSGTRWRLGGLSPAQARAVTPEPPTSTQVRQFDEFDRELFLALQTDGRRSYRDLASLLGKSESAVRRRIETLTRTGLMGFRTDFARVEAGWPTAIVLNLRATRAPAVGHSLVQYPQTRFCAATVGGPANLFVTMQLHRLTDLDPVLDRLLSEHPSTEILDQRVVLQWVKSWGRLIGPDGRADRVLPVDLWAPVHSHYARGAAAVRVEASAIEPQDAS